MQSHGSDATIALSFNRGEDWEARYCAISMVIRKPVNPSFSPAGQQQLQDKNVSPHSISPLPSTGYSKNTVPKSPSLQYSNQFRSDQFSNTSSQLRYDDYNVESLNEEWRDDNKDRGDATAVSGDSRMRQSTEQSQRQPSIPANLQLGNADVTPRTSSESLRSWDNHPTVTREVREEDAINKLSSQSTSSTNPYHRARSSERPPRNIARSNEESSVDVWAESAPPQSLVPLNQHTQG